MPIDNLGRLHLSAAQKTSISDALTTIEAVLLTVTQNLTTEERQRFGSVNETNKLLVNKALDYYQNQPSLSSPDVDWAEYELDFQDRSFADTTEQRMLSAVRMLTDFKIVHDFDNYQDALTDYDYSKYKAGTKTPGFTEKVADMKVFFPNSGGSGTPPSSKTE
ncbi:hypothetical protein NZ698_03880 [Chryseobacterium sp. PBS4-4]|uniref:Uncharacterized protein n=1 Tax=Chryseobacterium edaphi TaxID=2976532 RepID=A0ABT2W4P8_9FLAO|nr:hypothetical protein [Chryseobacterium edaphi]MCU7616324.1 hypothetical protein [Chryseobacterium edaphi]